MGKIFRYIVYIVFFLTFLNADVTITIDDNITDITNSDINFTFDFNESVDDFDSSDIDVVNGSKGDFGQSDDNKTYWLIVTPDKNIEDNVTVTVNENAVSKGNAKTTHSQLVDTKAPTIQSIDINDTVLNKKDKLKLTITFNE